MITKNTFEAVAKVIAETAPVDRHGKYDELYELGWASGCECACERIANNLADHFQADNPNFDRARFLEACKVADWS